jgi:hypothetical protein
MNKREGDLVATANHAVTHALFFAKLLQAKGGCATSVYRSRLLVTEGFADHRQALLIAPEIQTSSLKKVDNPGCS